MFTENSSSHLNGDQIASSRYPVDRIFWWIAITAYLGFCTWFVTRSDRYLVGYLADDAFYYLQIARHIAENGQPTFDGINPTNGFHPGWMVLLTVLAKIFANRELFLRASIVLEFSFHLLSAFYFSRIAKNLVGASWGLTAGAIWLINPYGVRMAMVGVEAPLVIAMLLATIAYYLDKFGPLIQDGKLVEIPVSNIVKLALLLAATIYARTDEVIFVVTIAVFIAVQSFRSRGEQPAFEVFRLLLRDIGIVALIIVVAVSPWLIYSKMAVGTIVQDSGTIKHLFTAYMVNSPGNDVVSYTLGFLAGNWVIAPANTIVGLYQAPFPLPVAVLFVPLLGLLFVGSLRRWNPNLTAISIWLLIYCILLGCGFATVGSDYQIWHSSTTSVVTVLMLVCWLGEGVKQFLSLTAQRACTAVIICVSVIPCIISWYLSPDQYPWQRSVYDAEPVVDRVVPQNQVVGAFDAGVLSYFSNHRVINLDGLVNHNVIPYFQKGIFLSYLRDNRIEYIADDLHSMRRATIFTQNDTFSIKTTTLYSTRLVDNPPSNIWRIIALDVHQSPPPI